MRKPDFIIGSADNPYMLRWWIIPRNRFFNICLHKIRRDDDDRALHDHPWLNCSILLSGSYTEITPKGRYVRTRGLIVFRRSVAAHRLQVGSGYAWSLFITGPRIREWGFHCPHGWVDWRIFTDKENYGEIGKGCNQ